MRSIKLCGIPLSSNCGPLIHNMFKPQLQREQTIDIKEAQFTKYINGTVHLNEGSKSATWEIIYAEMKQEIQG